uniref:Uncharacterized protein n=1 Tax=Arundo donax TaxID=35708 RepID=A0A0A9EL25_ARUDO
MACSTPLVGIRPSKLPAIAGKNERKFQSKLADGFQLLGLA